MPLIQNTGEGHFLLGSEHMTLAVAVARNRRLPQITRRLDAERVFNDLASWRDNN